MKCDICHLYLIAVGCVFVPFSSHLYATAPEIKLSSIFVLLSLFLPSNSEGVTSPGQSDIEAKRSKAELGQEKLDDMFVYGWIVNTFAVNVQKLF